MLTIDGDRGNPVAFEQVAPHVAVFHLEWENGLAMRRELFVGRGLDAAATVSNGSDREVEVVLQLELASDFADIFGVKRMEDLGAPGTSEVAPSRPERWQDARTVEFADQDFPARTLVHLDPAPDEVDGGTARYRLRLAPGERRHFGVAVQWLLSETPELDAAAFEAGLRDDRRDRDASIAAWWRSAPRCASAKPRSNTPGRNARRPGCTSAAVARSGMVPAAGAPWFMTLFGRDALLTSWMLIPLDPTLALGTLHTLAKLQGSKTDPLTEEEPGRILHEVRSGLDSGYALGGGDVYYGSSDATPLFVMLLGELRRWGVARGEVDRAAAARRPGAGLDRAVRGLRR